MTPFFEFIKPYKNSLVRLGRIITVFNITCTPQFVFCATKAVIKSLNSLQMCKIGTQIILSNTYHLMISPGSRLISFMGGIHKFMNWKKTIFSDSGGFQVFSLFIDNMRKKNHFEDGIFSVFLDNEIKYFLTPETSMQIQNNLSTDIIISFDKCIKFTKEKKHTRKSMQISVRWILRSYFEFQKKYNNIQVFYGIVPGGIYSDLRLESCSFLKLKQFFGYAVGGTIGNNLLQMFNIILIIKRNLFCNKPCHLLGIGKLIDIIESMKRGVDTVDCVHVTRISRHGNIFFFYDYEKKQYSTFNNNRQKTKIFSIDESCDCNTCASFSYTYVKYLVKIKENVGFQLIAIHNISFINRVLARILISIKSYIFL